MKHEMWPNIAAKEVLQLNYLNIINRHPSAAD